MTRKITITLLLLALGTSWAQAAPVQVEDEPEVDRAAVLAAAHAELRLLAQRIAEAEARVAKLSAELPELPPDTGMQAVLRRADGYLAEREARRQLAAKLAELFAEIRTHGRRQAVLLAQLSVEPDERAATAVVGDPASGGRGAADMDKARIAYYRVTAAADLRTIAALPEVYGDAAMWELLRDSNPRVVKTDDAQVPEGTILVVPALRVVAGFGFN